MKHAPLCAIGHNLADSMACGMCFVIGMYQVDMFGEAMRSEGGVLTVDFLAGKITQGVASPSLARAAELYAGELPAFCRKHGATVEDFTELTAAFHHDPAGNYVVVAVTDSDGRRSAIDYAGLPLRRPQLLDSLGRRRPKPAA
ncbi:MAG: hypothetical protein KF730_00885 [Sphingomonas sp.]|uniref:hypothetical protein n=1 Tax=Sphingomonas sp. TaxID=28214 RepID=UPI0025F4B731|nr:hypothetical protein [Sphingomonas sp.]MBX3563107.1 hypothetical protein [Sphingomonas sp.]